MKTISIRLEDSIYEELGAIVDCQVKLTHFYT